MQIVRIPFRYACKEAFYNDTGPPDLYNSRLNCTATAPQNLWRSRTAFGVKCSTSLTALTISIPIEDVPEITTENENGVSVQVQPHSLFTVLQCVTTPLCEPLELPLPAFVCLECFK